MIPKSDAEVNNDSAGISARELVLTIQRWFEYLFSKWIFILSLGILGAIIGAVYVHYKKVYYIATTTFVLEENGGGGLSQYGGLAAMIGLDIGGGGGGGGIFQGENIFELYASRNMVQKALLSPIAIGGKSELLIDRYIEINKMRKDWTGKLKNINFNLAKGQPFSRAQDSILAGVVANINNKYLFVGKQDKKLSIIKVDVKSTDEVFATAFNNQIVKTVNEFYIQTKTKKALQNLAILQHQTDSVKNVLNGAIYTTVAVADATPNLNVTRQILRAPAQRSQFNAEANKAILTQLVQNLEVAKLSLRRETPLIQVIDAPIPPLPVLKWTMQKGMALFGFLGVFLGVFIFSILKIYKSIME
jgi:hypothetical protein